MLLRSEVELQTSDSRQKGNIKTRITQHRSEKHHRTPVFSKIEEQLKWGKKQLVVSAHLKSPLLFSCSEHLTSFRCWF